MLEPDRQTSQQPSAPAGHALGEPPATRLLFGYLPGLACALFIAVVLSALHLTGARARVFLPEQVLIKAEDPRDAFRRLWDTGVRGRVFVVLAAHSRVENTRYLYSAMRFLRDPSGEPPVANHNYVSMLEYTGLARAFYIVVPDPEWPRVSAALRARWDVLHEGPRLRVRLGDARVTFTLLADLPPMSEKVVLDIAPGVSASYDPAALAALRDPAFADVVVEEGR